MLKIWDYLVISDFFRTFALQNNKRLEIMTYSLVITKQHSDPTYILNLKSWEDVIHHLKYKLDQYTIGVHIYKNSSNNRTLGERNVTMGNMWSVLNSPNDKILI